MDKPLAGKQICVIGAGLSGLAAASEARRLGGQVTVLEAALRLGGRVLTDRSLGVPVDLGAAAIHGLTGNPLTAFARAASAETLPLNYESIRYYLPNGARVPARAGQTAAQRFEQLYEAVRAQAAHGESVAETLRRIAPAALDDPLVMLHASVEFEFDIGGALAEIGAAQLGDDTPFGGGDLMLPAGFDQLVRFLACDLPVRLGAPVHRVAVSGQRVQVSSVSGAAEFDYCICTVPIGVLKHQRLTFAPGLPCGLASAIERLGAGHVTKVALKFDRVFWDRDPLYIGHASGRAGQFPYALNLEAVHRGSNILVTFALGDYDRGFEGRPDDTIRRDAMAMLRGIFGSDVPEPSGLVVTRWNEAPFSLCSYSFATPQTRREDFGAFGEVVYDRLLFAGEHSMAEHRGTAHGAYISGLRAATQLAGLCRTAR